MFNGKYVSLDYVAEGVYRDFGLSVDWSDAAEWVGEAMRLIGAPNVFINKRECITVDDYRAELPCDLISISHLRDCDTGIGMGVSSDETHLAYSENESTDGGKISYRINNNYVYASFKTGTIEVFYTAYPTDDNGAPLIPDDIKFIQAMKAYIGERTAFKMMLRGEITSASYEYINAERLFYVPAAKTSASMPSLDEMESIKNIILRSIPRVNEHKDSYKNISTTERRYNK